MRWLVVLVVLTITFAGCGGSSSSSSTSTSTTTSAPVVAPAPTAAGCSGEGSPAEREADLTLALDPATTAPAGPITWLLTVTNTSATPVDLVFPSARLGDVQIIDAQGSSVYLWSGEQAFAQVLQCQTIAAGGTARYELAGTLDLAPGDYRLTATVVAAPSPPPLSGTFRVSAG